MEIKTLLILSLIVLSYQNPINDLLIDESYYHKDILYMINDNERIKI